MSQYATICHSVWSLLVDVCNLIFLYKLIYTVGSSPTRRAKKKSRSKDLLFLFGFFSLPALPQRLMSVHLPWRTLIWEEGERWQCQRKRGGCPPVRGMSRSDKGSAVSGEERMTHERTRLRPSCRSTRRFVIPYGRY